MAFAEIFFASHPFDRVFDQQDVEVVFIEGGVAMAQRLGENGQKIVAFRLVLVAFVYFCFATFADEPPISVIFGP
ncbi:hypothetical protein [Rhodopirellula islandica]|uniref:hypothetical protein n=1 Tax=Rhodopirellula islandica TaxID=595434 RepID=UPI00191C085A|nr:hypothetical protein [Rhodopirellula islandica]